MNIQMIGQNNPTSDTVADIISKQIDLLSKIIPQYSASGSVHDLGEKAVLCLSQLFPGATVEFAYRAGKPREWKVFCNSTEQLRQSFRVSLTHEEGIDHTEEIKDDLIKILHAIDAKSSIGIIIKKNDEGGMTSVDLITLKLFIFIIKTAFQNIFYKNNEKNLLFSLNHRILQLNSLIETGIEVEKLDQRSSPHHLALTRAASLTNSSYAKVQVKSDQKIKEEFYFPEHTRNNQTAENGNFISTGFTHRGDTYSFELFDKESRDGTIPFDETDRLLLEALAKQVHASLENQHLHRESLEKQRIEQDILVAATIQQKIIPVRLPVIEGYDLAGINIPSRSVGGDYYDCLPVLGGKHILVIADVAGKGVQAALLVSSFHSYLSAYSEGISTLKELASRLNNVLFKESTDDKFITAFIVKLDPGSGEIEYINAGHNPAYILTKKKEIIELGGSGLPLGIFPGTKFPSGRGRLKSGDRLLLYTDGVTEAQNEAGIFYEQKHPLGKYLSKRNCSTAKEFIAGLIADIRRFTGAAPQNDDITVMSLWRL